jgi:hypothetical protein
VSVPHAASAVIKALKAVAFIFSHLSLTYFSERLPANRKIYQNINMRSKKAVFMLAARISVVRVDEPSANNHGIVYN